GLHFAAFVDGQRYIVRHAPQCLPQRLAPMTDECDKCIGVRQTVERARIELASAEKIFAVGKGCGLPCCKDALATVRMQSLDHVQAKAQCRCSLCAGFQCRLPLAYSDIDRPYFHAMASGVLHQLCGCIETERLAVQQT